MEITSWISARCGWIIKRSGLWLWSALILHLNRTKHLHPMIKYVSSKGPSRLRRYTFWLMSTVTLSMIMRTLVWKYLFLEGLDPNSRHILSGDIRSSDRFPPYPPSIPPYFLPSSTVITAVERDGWRSPPGSLQGVAGLSNAQVCDCEVH